MNNELKREKQEIKEIINEIDTIMFGRKINNKSYTCSDAIYGAVIGTSFGSISSYFIPEDTPIIAYAILGLGLVGGTIVGGIIGKKYDVARNYVNYENAYLSLTREEQLKVLKLSKQLVELYKKDLENNKNNKRIKKYLELENENTKFDNYEKNHPHFEILSQEQIDEIHKKGKLTPMEKYNEWASMGYCPASGGSSVRCDKYENCRDCTVAWAEAGKEWNPMNFEAINVLDRINNQKKIVR